MILKLNTYKFGEKEIEVNNIEEAIILLNSYVDFHQIGASDMNCEFGYLYDKNNKKRQISCKFVSEFYKINIAVF